MFEPQIITLLGSSSAVTSAATALLGVIKNTPEYMIALKTWAVFILCWSFSLVGVAASFLLFSATISGFRFWGISIVIAIAMISLSYGQKYAKVESRTSFTPVDLITYLIQGFLWPTTWPTLAHTIGIQSTITAPGAPAKVGFIILHVSNYAWC